LVFVSACGGGGGGNTPSGTLEILPDNAALEVQNGVAVEQAYQAFLHRPDGQVIDVTANTIFAIDQTDMGSFAGPKLTVGGFQAGLGTIRARSGDIEDTAGVIVNVAQTRVDGDAPDNAPALFEGAAESPGLVPSVVYPSDQVLVPPNLGDLEVHWQAPMATNLYEVTLTGDHLTLQIYTGGTPNDWLPISLAEWKLVGRSLSSNSFEVKVRAMDVAAPTLAGTSNPIKVFVATQDVEGGLYYWATVSTDGSPEGIYRHDMGRPGEAPEQFFTTTQTPGNRCVACHALSRDGTKMAVVFDGGNGAGSVLDVLSGTLDLPVDGSFRWNFASFAPQNDRMITALQGALTLRNATTGAVVSTVPGAEYKTHPDYAPDGTRIAYVAADSHTQDWVFSGGKIVTRTIAANGTYGDAVPLVDTDDNAYYPSWSPDSQWIAFNRSGEDSYDDSTARIWVASADGTVAPILLSAADVNTGLTNSWPRWTPFSQIYAPGGSTGEQILWLTFASKRAYGVRLAAGRPQIWMAPFFPERARAGLDATGPAFRLPFQSINTNNHIAQWTEQIVQID
jgi:hypothetical protein